MELGAAEQLLALGGAPSHSHKEFLVPASAWPAAAASSSGRAARRPPGAEETGFRGLDQRKLGRRGLGCAWSGGETPLPGVPWRRAGALRGSPLPPPDSGQSAPLRAGIGAAATTVPRRGLHQGGASLQLRASPRGRLARGRGDAGEEEGTGSGDRNWGTAPPAQAAPGNACLMAPQGVTVGRGPGRLWVTRRSCQGTRSAAAPPLPSPESEEHQVDSIAGIFWLKSPILPMGSFRARK